MSTKQRKINRLEIERQAEKFLKEYQERYSIKLQAPVDISNIMDCMCDFHIICENLQEKYGDDVLGAIIFDDEERTIIVDSLLDPDKNSKMLGRYNFTVAHEAGHWILHSTSKRNKDIKQNKNKLPKKYSVLCRSGKYKKRPLIEKEADCFAGYILMPKKLIVEAWQNSGQNISCTINVFEELVEQRKVLELSENNNTVTCLIAKKLAEIFEVSALAMQIRLVELGLIEETEHI